MKYLPWFGYGFYKIFCGNFILFEGGDVVASESNYRCRFVPNRLRNLYIFSYINLLYILCNVHF
jgi:hypothetical protein